MIETPKEAANRLARPVLDKGFKPVALHTYTNAEGETLYWRIRAKHPASGDKWIRPMRLNGHGYELKEPQFEKGKPLYGLHRIASNPGAVVWITEGEQKADALNKLGLVAATSGGVTSAEAADWQPLARRTVRIWPDNDDPGKAYAGNVASVLLGMGCTVSCIDVDKLGLRIGEDAIEWLEARPGAAGSDIEVLPMLAVQQSAESAPVGREWPVLNDAALYGLAGDIVRATDPHTESDRVAILVQIMVAFGAYINRGCHVLIEGDQHHSNLFCVLVGTTSKGRKGTSWGRVRLLFEQLPRWVKTVSGLSSGEGLKYNVRDATAGKNQKDAGDPGVIDKRLLVIEPEFAQVLRATARTGNTLSSTMREAWDTGTLRTLTKNDPITATGAHVCVVAHVTADELRSELTETDRGNGFANRFLFVCVKRSKMLPLGGDRLNKVVVEGFVRRLESAVEAACVHAGPVVMTESARAAWWRVYPTLSEGYEGLLGAVTARAEAQVIRLALIYALMDQSIQIEAKHLIAALALWEYCEASARFIFGTALGHRVADEILRSLRATGPSGLTRTEISHLFKRHESAERIGVALEMLNERSLALSEMRPTDGRPVEVWKAR